MYGAFLPNGILHVHSVHPNFLEIVKMACQLQYKGVCHAVNWVSNASRNIFPHIPPTFYV
jgi:hypothetical protein